MITPRAVWVAPTAWAVAVWAERGRGCGLDVDIVAEMLADEEDEDEEDAK